MSEVDHTLFEKDFSDYYERTLAPARAREIEAHLGACDRCRIEFERFRETIDALSGLHKMAAPQKFEDQVADTIHRRSAGRFFGRRAFGDRVPFELLGLLAVVLAAALIVLLRRSSTGTVHSTFETSHAPGVSEEAKQAIPRLSTTPDPAVPPPSPTRPAAPAEPLAPGTPAPDFRVTAHDDTEVSIAALKGKPIVLYFYPKDQTPGCTLEAQEFRDAFADFQAVGAVILGVSTDDNASHRDFAEKEKIPYPLLPDQDRTITTLYGVDTSSGHARRTTFVIGPDGAIFRTYPQVDVRGHEKEVLADVKNSLGMN